MEEKRKKLVAKKNGLEMLAKKLVSMGKRFKGSDWHRGGKNHIRRGYGDTKKGMSEDKVGGNFDLSVQCDNCQKYFTDISSLPKNGFVV